MRKIIKEFLALALFATFLASLIPIIPVKASDRLVLVPGTYLTLADALANLQPGDHIHILNTYTGEQWQQSYSITYSNVWIIGAPPHLGTLPSVDINGHSLIITTSNVFIWGLNFIDSSGSTSSSIQFYYGSTGCARAFEARNQGDDIAD